jgi:hypothetical protein
MDCWSGYHQIKLDAHAQRMTQFFMPGMGLFVYTALPFGVKPASEIFCAAMEVFFEGMIGKGVDFIIDDLCVTAESFGEHVERVTKVLERCRKHGLSLKPKKLQICVKDLEFMGFTIAGTRLKMQEGKSAAITNWQRPSNTKELQSFIGLASYYRRFVKDFARVASPLRVKADQAFRWTQEKEDAFGELKRMIKENVMLEAPDWNKMFYISADWCKEGIGAEISQMVTNEATGREELRPVEFASKSTAAGGSQLTATMGELVAVVFALDKFRKYVFGRRCRLYSDHSALIYMATFERTTRDDKMSRWLQRMLEYDVDFMHRPGEQQVVADALSRQQIGVVETER